MYTDSALPALWKQMRRNAGFGTGFHLGNHFLMVASSGFGIGAAGGGAGAPLSEAGTTSPPDSKYSTASSLVHSDILAMSISKSSAMASACAGCGRARAHGVSDDAL